MSTNEYPFSVTGTIVLSEEIYEAYGGWTGSSTLPQRQLAYWSAERQISEHINTFLTEAYVTGVYPFPYVYNHAFALKHVRVGEVVSIRYIGQTQEYYVSGSSIPNSMILDGDYGILNSSLLYSLLYGLCSNCPSSNSLDSPINMEIVYKTGLPPNMADEPNLRIALMMAAEINLKELSDAGALEGGRGDPGVENFASANYRENRVKMIRTIFGTSAIANKIRTLLLPYRKNSPIKF